jgi:hypothetical protein
MEEPDEGTCGLADGETLWGLSVLSIDSLERGNASVAADWSAWSCSSAAPPGQSAACEGESSDALGYGRYPIGFDIQDEPDGVRTLLVLGTLTRALARSLNLARPMDLVLAARLEPAAGSGLVEAGVHVELGCSSRGGALEARGVLSVEGDLALKVDAFSKSAPELDPGCREAVDSLRIGLEVSVADGVRVSGRLWLDSLFVVMD